MRFFLKNAALALSLVATAGFVACTMTPAVYAQTETTGALSGAVLDGTGAAVPGATVVITDPATNSQQTLVTNAEGRYTASLLKPGLYKVTASAAGLQSETIQASVILGTTVPIDIQVTPKGDKTIIEVTSTSLPLVDTQNVALATTFSEQQIQELPTPGGDVTTVAFTAPGVVVNAGGAYGNFSSDGLPGISNLFVLNGFDNQDPFLNLNNSGSSNLTLGQGELQEATVVQNGYNSQYGRAAGAVINYTTKSGTNRFHGMADYNYNGTVLNANGWFNQFYGGARPHAVSNEWAANGGGPIIKDKVFFFSDYEGLHYVLPDSSGPVTFPSPALQSYVLAHVPAVAKTFYGQAFQAYQSAPAYGSAKPVANGSASNQDGQGNLGCGVTADVAPGYTYGGLTGTVDPGVGTFGTTVPCMTVGQAQANNINIEWLYTQRIDWNVSDKQKIYGRYKMDHGSQPTFTSFINPLFSAVSIQPEYEGQFNDSYMISGNKTNVFVAASNWYSAYFGPGNVTASYNELPMFFVADAGLDASGVNASAGLPLEGVPGVLTQGRNVTQYQLEDDFNWIVGKHTIKFGGNFRRDLVEDYDSQINTIFPQATLLSLSDFASGGVNGVAGNFWDAIGANSFGQAFTATQHAHLALYNVGIYAQDEWQVLPNLKLTLGVRVDRTGNPLCHNGCFSSYSGSFPSSNAGLTSPYNAGAGGPVSAQNWHPFPTIQKANIQPRFGFNYSFDGKTEVRGGVGIFSDLYPAGFVDGVIQNFPNYNAVTVYGGAVAPTGSGSVGTFAATANSVVQGAFARGGSVQDINKTLTAQGVPFAPPNYNAYFPGTFKVPEYVEYSLQLQRQLTRNDAVILTYAGNYGYDGVLIDPLINASAGGFANSTGTWTSAGTFANFPVTPPDPRFSRMSAFTNNGHSNYNGGMVSIKHNAHGLTGQLSYTYSHSMDDVSNGGEGEPFNGGSVTTQITPAMGPGNLNYSNSDYDIRNNMVGDGVYEEPFKSSNKILDNLAGGWVLGAKTYWRTGEPFSITNENALGAFHTAGASLPAELRPGLSIDRLNNFSTHDAHRCVNSDTRCLNVGDYVPSAAQDGFGTLRRNAQYGPHYADTDLSVSKKVIKTEGITLSVGANAYNVFNKVNFAAPSNDIGSSTFGEILGAEAPPTSPYGSFQGAAVTQRLLQVHGKITF
jgi:hypothetical protein